MPTMDRQQIEVLVVDDDPIVAELIQTVLDQKGYAVMVAPDGRRALELFARHRFTVVLVDIHLPDLSGIELLRRIKKATPTCQVIVFSGAGTMDDVTEALRLGACDYLVKPVNFELLDLTVRRCAERHDLIAERIGRQEWLEEAVALRTASLSRALDETVKSLGRCTEMRDPYTAGHQQRVARLAAAIGDHMKLSASQLRVIHVAGLLHDIGKLAVPVELLVKPSRLAEAETHLIRSHPQAGYEILRDIPFDDLLGHDIATIVQQHHERMDGTGYPGGRVGDDICLEARILSVADMVEAMSSHRPYRPAKSIESVRHVLEVEQVCAFDPDVVRACLSLLDHFDGHIGKMIASILRKANDLRI